MFRLSRQHCESQYPVIHCTNKRVTVSQQPKMHFTIKCTTGSHQSTNGLLFAEVLSSGFFYSKTSCLLYFQMLKCSLLAGDARSRGGSSGGKCGVTSGGGGGDPGRRLVAAPRPVCSGCGGARRGEAALHRGSSPRTKTGDHAAVFASRGLHPRHPLRSAPSGCVCRLQRRCALPLAPVHRTSKANENIDPKSVLLCKL